MLDFLIITPPNFENFEEAIFDNIDRWKFNLLDRSALELCSFLENNGYTVDYIPFNLLYPYYNDKDILLIKEEIIKFDFRYIIIASYFLTEGTAADTIDKLITCDLKSCDKVFRLGNYFAIKRCPTKYAFNGSFEQFYNYLENNRDLFGIIESYEPFRYIPSYHLVEKYIDRITFNGKGKMNLVLKTSTKCPYNCAFCSTNIGDEKQKYISKSFIDKELDEIDRRFNLEKVSFDCFVDDCFGVDEIVALDVLSCLNMRNIKIKYALMSVNIILKSTKIWERMIPVVENILIGIENSNQSILDKVEKPQTFGKAIEAIVKVKKLGFKTHLNWIIGLPGETTNNIRINLKVMAYLLRTGLADTIEPQLFVPFPWTRIYNNEKKYGITNRNISSRYYDEKGFLSCFDSQSIERSSLERGLMLALIVCNSAKEIRYSLNSLKELLDKGSVEIVNDIKRTVVCGDIKIIEATIRGEEC